MCVWPDFGRPGRAPGSAEARAGHCSAAAMRARPAGLRDLAMLTLLTQLGRRDSEVSGPALDDIDRRAGKAFGRRLTPKFLERRLERPTDHGSL
jgi:hypothetical protein